MTEEKIYSLLKKLEGRIEYLEEQLIKKKRENANLMEQLQNGDNGITSSFVEAVDKKFSEIMQTEEKIQMTVADVSDDARKQFSVITQKADSIQTEVATIFDAVFEVDVYPGRKENYDELKDYIGCLITYEGSNYYYSKSKEKWVETEDRSISSSFKQTSEGFFLDGNVKIDGNTYQNGKIISSSFYATGDSGKGSAIYIYNGNETSNSENKVGFISYEPSKSAEFSAGEKIVIASEMGKSLKLVTYADSGNEIKSGNISIGAGMHRDNHTYAGYGGYIYIGSPISFSGGHIGIGDSKSDVLFGNDPYNKCQVDFTYATVVGLHAVFE